MSVRGYRPIDLAAPTYTERELARRQKWVERQRRKGNRAVNIHDAPEVSETTSRRNGADEWVTPCRSCGRAGLNFDLTTNPEMPYGLVRYCVPCHRTRRDAWNERNADRFVIYEARYRERAAQKPCPFDGCDRRRVGRWCAGHAKQLVRAGGDQSKMRPLRPYLGKRGPNRKTAS